MENKKLFDVSVLLTAIKYDHELHIGTNKVVLKWPNFIINNHALCMVHLLFHTYRLLLLEQHQCHGCYHIMLALIIKTSVWGFLWNHNLFHHKFVSAKNDKICVINKSVIMCVSVYDSLVHPWIKDLNPPYINLQFSTWRAIILVIHKIYLSHISRSAFN